MRPGSDSALVQFADGAASFFAVIESATVHVHADEFVGEFRVHIARELQGVLDGRLAMFQTIGNAFADDARNLQPHSRTQAPPDGISHQEATEAL